MDPRIEAIEKRLASVDTVIPVASGKGGVGKSLIASTISLITSERDKRVGLLDLDLHGPSAHVILGLKDFDFPEEEKGILPEIVSGIEFMSTVYYSQEKPSPLRGDDISESIKELLAITRWSDLDYLFLDMPPGVGNEVLDTINLVKDPSFLIATTPSDLSISNVGKLVEILRELDISISGVVENMRNENSPDIENKVEDMNVNHLGEIWYDPEVENAIGDPEKILKTRFSDDLRKIFDNIPELPSG